MRKNIILTVGYCVFSLLISAPAGATGTGLQEVFQHLRSAVQAKDKATIHSNVTQESHATVERLTGYGLESCLPQNLSYASERYEGDAVYVTAASSVQDGEVLSSELIFRQENNQWKLDVPGSLRNGLGEDWEQKLGQIELLYTTLQAQFGGAMNCSLVQQILTHTSPTNSVPRIIAQ